MNARACLYFCMCVYILRLVRDLRGLYVCVWKEMCFESSNYLLFFLYRIVFVSILMSSLEV